MIGIEFQVPNEYSNFLYKILCEIDVAQYEWSIITDDILEKKYIDDKTTISDGIFSSEWLSGEEFLRCIAKDNYYMIFVDVKAFEKGAIHATISTFDDFINSDCQMILLCEDSQFVTLFCKTETVLQKVCTNCCKYGFRDIRFIELEEGHKYSMIGF